MQSGLFEQNINSSHFEDLNLGDAAIRIWPAAFSEGEANAFFNDLYNGIDWRQETLWIAGQERAVPRLQCWMGDTGSLYGYSGMRLEPVPWSTEVSEIKSKVEALTSQSFNSVLLNLYRDGQDSVSWHADDEPELGLHPCIASVSLGTERKFELKHKRDKNIPISRIQLPHGSVLLMDRYLQQNWLHQVPKVKGLSRARINLTFRQIFHHK